MTANLYIQLSGFWKLLLYCIYILYDGFIYFMALLKQPFWAMKISCKNFWGTIIAWVIKLSRNYWENTNQINGKLSSKGNEKELRNFNNSENFAKSLQNYWEIIERVLGNEEIVEKCTITGLHNLVTWNYLATCKITFRVVAYHLKLSVTLKSK